MWLQFCGEFWYDEKVRRIIFALIFLCVLGGLGWYFRFALAGFLFAPRSGGSSQSTGVTLTDFLQTDDEESIQIVAQNLDIPWEVVFLPDESLLVTSRAGSLVRLWPDRQQAVPVEGVAHVGEGGLLGLALHPDYERNQLIYLYSTTREGGRLTNRVERYRFDQAANALHDREVIVANIPGASNHDGGRIAFGPDGMLYITTGDAENPNSAQDTSALSGKILRLTPDGQVPADNPFGNAVYSYGHRNPQGLAWDSAGQLWATEHGPSGSQTGNDEVNRIVKGGNYGWPTIRGTQTREGMIAPVLESGRSDTWAPAGTAIVGDVLFFTGLRGQALYSAQIVGERLTDFKQHFASEYGRLRAVVVSPDAQWLYITTSNRDGRGAVNAGDDKLIRLKTELFF